MVRTLPRSSVYALAMAMTLAISGRAVAATDPTSDAASGPFRMVARSFIGLAEAMPADKYDFKPSAGEFKTVRTFGEQVKRA